MPGYHRMMLGEFEVTAWYDGFIPLDPKVFKGLSAQEVQALLARLFVPTTPQGAAVGTVNAFLVNTGEHLILVDAGTAKAFGPSLGFIADNLRAAGYTPEQVDLVLLTHLHPDHARGLLAPDGQALFPNAQVRAAQADADFWLDEKRAAQAPSAMQPLFQMARESVAPYTAQGRFKAFQPGEALAAGVSSSPEGGHTPGHTGYVFTSKEQSLLVWGDLVHNHAVQMPRPEISLEFDVDGKQAIATRKRVFAEVVKNKHWVAGAHLPFPGLGHLRVDGRGYAWVPMEYGPLPATP